MLASHTKLGNYLILDSPKSRYWDKNCVLVVCKAIPKNMGRVGRNQTKNGELLLGTTEVQSHHFRACEYMWIHFINGHKGYLFINSGNINSAAILISQSGKNTWCTSVRSWHEFLNLDQTVVWGSVELLLYL